MSLWLSGVQRAVEMASWDGETFLHDVQGGFLTRVYTLDWEKRIMEGTNITDPNCICARVGPGVMDPLPAVLHKETWQRNAVVFSGTSECCGKHMRGTGACGSRSRGQNAPGRNRTGQENAANKSMTAVRETLKLWPRLNLFPTLPVISRGPTYFVCRIASNTQTKFLF